MEISDKITGLTSAQAAERAARGQTNKRCDPPTKSIWQIIVQNICTLFNLINFIIAAAVLAAGSYKNLLFMGVVICNLLIGIVQEIRAKRAVDRLSVISAAKACVIRDGEAVDIPTDEVVTDDVVRLTAGSQISADSVVIDGECSVDESFVTGEADAISKQAGDSVLAGSFVVSGTCLTRVVAVGDGNYISSISKAAGAQKDEDSEIMRSLKKLIRIISIIIVPVGALFFMNQLSLDGGSYNAAAVNTAAAVIGMIPEGLMLLTSTVLAVGVVRLSKRSVLVQQLYCIETLARVDVLCLDKTGTITEGRMEVRDIIPLADIPFDGCAAILGDLSAALEDNNATMSAVRARFSNDASARQSVCAFPFSSKTKWSGAEFDDSYTYILGAAEFILKDMPQSLRERIDSESRLCRVLLLCRTTDRVTPDCLPDDIEPLALVTLNDVIRANVNETLKYFRERGVDIKVISGDNVGTVQSVAAAAGVKNCGSAISTAGLTDDEVAQAAEKYTVFGRVTPEQKRVIVNSLKSKGHTVAMTGDGVNDVPSLRAADCSIALSGGTDAARNISQLVLLDSDFDSLPDVVAEGRRCVNNIQRSSALFLVKTIYSTIMAVLFIFLNFTYPFMPIQLTLISVCTVGIPSFILALGPNRERIRGSFLGNIMRPALPGALTIVFELLATALLARWLRLMPEAISTVSVLLTAYVSFMVLFRVCLPWNRLRAVLFISMTVLFLILALVLNDLLALSPIGFVGAALLAALAAVSTALYILLVRLLGRSGGEKRNV